MQSRVRRVLGAGVANFVSRAVAAGVGFASVPLALDYLGPERYGAWVSLVSLLAWAQLADLGVANGLTNALADAYGRRATAEARAYVSTALVFLSCIAAACALAFGIGAAPLDWAKFFNVHSPLAREEVPRAVLGAVAVFLASFPLSLTDRVYAAYQQGVYAVYWSILGSIASLCAIILAISAHLGLAGLVLSTAGARLLATAASTADLFWRRLPELRPSLSLFDRSLASRLARTGGLFFVLQVGALILYNTDNLVIARVIGAAAVTPYAVAWTLFTIPSLAASIVFPYLWPAYTAALAEGDWPWIIRVLRRSIAGSGTAGIVLAAVLLWQNDTIISWWAGPSAVAPAPVARWMAIWSVVVAFMSPVTCLLNAAGRLRGQATYGAATSALNLGLSVWWARVFGLSGVIAGTVVSYGICAVVPSIWELTIVVTRRSTPARTRVEGIGSA